VIGRRRAALLASAAATAAALAVALPAAGAPGPRIEQLIVFRNGATLSKRVVAGEARVRVHGRRCAVAAGTPLAALVRSHPGRLGLRDFGSCSLRPSDGSGLFVSGIRKDRNRGQNGWVYKLGRRAGTAGAADPSGPFGAGRLRAGARVTWFYCQMADGGCQRTLAVRPTLAPGGLWVQVSGYDDRGQGVPIADATVHVGASTVTTGADGLVLAPAPMSPVRVYAEKDGLVRSFAERVAPR
jgi:hypothetical protein